MKRSSSDKAISLSCKPDHREITKHLIYSSLSNKKLSMVLTALSMAVRMVSFLAQMLPNNSSSLGTCWRGIRPGGVNWLILGVGDAAACCLMALRGVQCW